MNPEPQREHVWLHKLVGDWTYETSLISAEGPSAERSSEAQFRGSETVRSIGGLWVIAEGQGDAPGAIAVTSLMTIGFDPEKRRFTGTWIGSMMAHLWLYDGELDAAGRILTLDSEGPSMRGDGSTASYRDVIEVKHDDHRILRALVQEDGTWREFMTTHYRRSA